LPKLVSRYWHRNYGVLIFSSFPDLIYQHWPRRKFDSQECLLAERKFTSGLWFCHFYVRLRVTSHILPYDDYILYLIYIFYYFAIFLDKMMILSLLAEMHAIQPAEAFYASYFHLKPSLPVWATTAQHSQHFFTFQPQYFQYLFLHHYPSQNFKI
jgi:hypothetical protein